MPEAPRAARDTKRQHRLTAAEDADVARALMTRITLLSAGLLEYAQPGGARRRSGRAVPKPSTPRAIHALNRRAAAESGTTVCPQRRPGSQQGGPGRPPPAKTKKGSVVAVGEAGNEHPGAAADPPPVDVVDVDATHRVVRTDELVSDRAMMHTIDVDDPSAPTTGA